MKNPRHMLIDGKNAIYRAIFAGYYDERFKKSRYDYFVITVRFISNYLTTFNPQSVHIFWDAPRESTWRREISPEYKEHRAEKYKDLTINIHDELNRHQRFAIETFKNLGCRQYYRSRMEADDLIYSFCLLNKKASTIIVSSDGDMRQIPYRMNHVRIYNPLQRKKRRDVDPIPTEDIVTIKALAGDSSDNIAGYYNIGPVRSKQMTNDPRLLYEFLLSEKAVIKERGKKRHVGDTAFRKNQLLIDLSRCPELTENCGYVMAKQDEAVIFDPNKLKTLTRQRKIVGLLGDLGKYSHPFRNLR